MGTKLTLTFAVIILMMTTMILYVADLEVEHSEDGDRDEDGGEEGVENLRRKEDREGEVREASGG